MFAGIATVCSLIYINIIVFSQPGAVTSSSSEEYPENGPNEETVTTSPNIDGAAAEDTKEQQDYFSQADLEKFKVWTDGKIEYYIDDLSYDKVSRDKIRMLLDQANKVTGLNFMELPKPPEDEDHRYVFFINRRFEPHCVRFDTQSLTMTGPQRVVLGYQCLAQKSLAHIVMAVAGVPPQSNAPDRDDYIQVFPENIVKGREQSWNKLSESSWPFNDLPYDFNSVTHLRPHDYTNNGNAVMKVVDPAKAPLGTTLGEAEDFSPIDLKKINKLYTAMRLSKKTYTECDKIFYLGNNANVNLDSDSEANKNSSDTNNIQSDTD